MQTSSMRSSSNLEEVNKKKKKKKKKNNNTERACQVVTWKSIMQSWSLQCRAPGLCCKLMAKAKTPVALLTFSCKNWGKEEEEEEEEEEISHSMASLELPTLKPVAPRRSNGSCNSTSIASPYSSKPIHLGNASGSWSLTPPPSPSPSPSPSSSSSYRLRGIVSGQHSFLQLFGGNQFLTRITAAPVGAGRRSADLAPSAGLVNVPRRHSDADLRDRIIFFQ